MAEIDRTVEWRDVPGYEGAYRVSSDGRITSRRCPDRLLSPRDVLGYRQVTLFDGRGGMWQPLVHRLVAAAFIGPCPDGLQVNHKNGVRHDNNVSNLEYVTRRENMLHAIHVLNIDKYEKRGRTKLTVKDVLRIRRECDTVEKRQAAAAMLGVSQPTILKVVNRETWRHV